MEKRRRKNTYKTWKKASKATIKLGIKSWPEYMARYREDKCLPSNPYSYYKNFPCWVVFFGGSKKEFYSTWQKASKATIKLGIRSHAQYEKRYKEDKKLPSKPYRSYKNFPGFRMFLKSKYQTWQEASVVAIRMDIKSKSEYLRRYKEDKCLPSNPCQFYQDFPGFKKFLEKT